MELLTHIGFTTIGRMEPVQSRKVDLVTRISSQAYVVFLDRED